MHRSESMDKKPELLDFHVKMGDTFRRFFFLMTFEAGHVKRGRFLGSIIKFWYTPEIITAARLVHLKITQLKRKII